MDNTTHTIRIGTRNSRLAMIQTEMVADSLRAAAPGTQVLLEARLTTGDKILNKPLQEFGGKGVFVSEFEEGILEGRLDLAVHSAKDMPMELAEGLSIVGVPRREDPRDVLVTASGRPVPETGEIVIGTSSPRRKLQIELLGTELWPGGSVRCENLRGNVQTRLGKLESSMYHGIILAAAGLKRLGLLEDPRYNFQFLECESFIPAGGQGGQQGGRNFKRDQPPGNLAVPESGAAGVKAPGCRVPRAHRRLLPAGGRSAGSIWNQRQERPGI